MQGQTGFIKEGLNKMPKVEWSEIKKKLSGLVRRPSVVG